MTSGLVNASFSSPKGQAVKMIFFAPCPSTRFCPVLVHTQKVLGPASTSIFVERREKDREVGWMDRGKDILGDPGADSGGEGKSKRAEK